MPSSQCGSRLFVKAGDPGASHLLGELDGTNLCFGTEMPKTGGVTAAEISTLATWVCSGAKND